MLAEVDAARQLLLAMLAEHTRAQWLHIARSLATVARVWFDPRVCVFGV